MPSTSSAQTATGQITGTVRDATGAVMSDVKVVVTNQQTGLTRETTTGDNGDYVVPLLPVGVYVVTGEQTGFKTAVHSDIALTVDQIQRVDMQLATGNVTETVEVQSNALVLDTGSASVGHTITEKQVTELPLNGRNFLQLLFLGAGAVETGGEQGGMRQGVGNAISIMGARPTSNNFMIDGTANIDTSLGTPAAVLSVDAIQEFKEQTTTYSAEYGFSSNQINLVSKTGTNAFHGTVFGFFRNDAWDARNFFDDKTSPAPELDQKQFGFVVGGPVMLPGYDGRNRTFFLVNYEGTRIDRGATNFYTVPTPEQLAGRFSTHDHRSARPAHRSRTTPFRSRDSRGSRSWRSGTTGSRRRTRRPRRATTRPSARFRRSRTSSRSAATRTWRSSAVCSSAIRTPPMRTRTPATPSIPATACSCRTPRTGRSRTAGRSTTRSSTSSGSAAWTPAPISTASPARRRTWTSSA